MCLIVLVNCLLNAFAMCMGEVTVFSLKVSFVVIVFCWLIRVWSSKDYVYCVCDPSVCYLHISYLCVCMRDVISEFNSVIRGSHASCALMLILCSILWLMCSESSLQAECILTFGMLCLSAWRMMFVKTVFAMCISGGG